MSTDGHLRISHFDEVWLEGGPSWISDLIVSDSLNIVSYFPRLKLVARYSL